MDCNRNEAMQMPAMPVRGGRKRRRVEERSLGGEAEKGKAGRSEDVTEQSSPEVYSV